MAHQRPQGLGEEADVDEVGDLRLAVEGGGAADDERVAAVDPALAEVEREVADRAALEVTDDAEAGPAAALREDPPAEGRPVELGVAPAVDPVELVDERLGGPAVELLGADQLDPQPTPRRDLEELRRRDQAGPAATARASAVSGWARAMTVPAGRRFRVAETSTLRRPLPRCYGRTTILSQGPWYAV
ncbi:MAG: hypothetical protein KC420_20095 [Myxococcales bacterium]|nr:hypothetical protein [Myxococcales bacterium]MCB9566945.1 hypothetical protein [Myxococcales bacterium]